MLMNKNNVSSPEQMLHKVKHRKFFLNARPWIKTAIVFLLITTLLSTIAILPYVRIYGTAMEPTLLDGDLGLAISAKDYHAGDIIAFRHGDKVLVRRIIAVPGSTVEIDESGIVTVDGITLEEPYLTQPALQQCNIQFPYTVPDGEFFVMGDNRADSVDSRSTVLGCVSKDEVIGRVVVIFFPFNRFQWNPSEAHIPNGGSL